MQMQAKSLTKWRLFLPPSRRRLFRCRLALLRGHALRSRLPALQPAEPPKGDGSGILVFVGIILRNLASELLDDGERTFVDVEFLA